MADDKAATGRGGIDELASGPLGGLLFRYSWPALAAMVLNALYSVVDRLWIGQGCGEAAMAGLQLTMPLMMFFGACGVFIGAGHATILSIRLGAGDFEACEKIVGQLVALKLLFFLVLPPLVYFNLDAFIGWCGGSGVSEAAREAAKAYLRTVVFFGVFSHLAFGLSALQRAEGGAIRSMMSMMVGFGANLLLDPLFIFGFGLGVTGAAWATNVSMMLSFAWAARYYLRGDTTVAFRWRRIGLYRELLGKSSALGFAPFLQNVLGSLICVSMSAAFAKWADSPDSATRQIASLGVYNAMTILTIMPIMGAQQGLQPIIGYNWGARNFRRVHAALRLGLWATAALCAAAFVMQVVPPFPRLMVGMFVPTGNQALAELATHDLAVANCMIWTIFVNVVATTYFQSIGHPRTAVVLSTLRQGVILLPCIWILPFFMRNHSLAIWLALPISDVLCQLATVLPLVLHARFLSRVRHRHILR